MQDLNVDFSLNLSGESPIDADHAYFLFSGLSNLVPEIHGGGLFAVHPVKGSQTRNRKLILKGSSRISIRTPSELIGTLLPLAGANVRIGSSIVQCGMVPQIFKLMPTTSLRSRIVTIKISGGKFGEGHFIDSLRRKLVAIGVNESVQIELPRRQTHQGEMRSAQRTIRIKDREIIGYEVRLHGLSGEESIAVQSHGIGGRRAMGCGLFLPFRPVVKNDANAEAEAVSDA